MCGRSRCSLAPHQVAAAAKIPEERWRNREAYTPSHNVAPGHNTPVVKRDKTQELEVHTMKYADRCATADRPLNHTHLSVTCYDTVLLLGGAWSPVLPKKTQRKLITSGWCALFLHMIMLSICTPEHLQFTHQHVCDAVQCEV